MLLFQSLFTEKLVEDNRQPCLSFEFYNNQYHVEIYPPMLQFYIQVTVLLLLQMFLSCFLGIILYYGIVCPQQEKKQQQQQQQQQQRLDKKKLTTTTTTITTTTTSTSGMLIGYGIIIPVALWLPFMTLNYWDIRSKNMRLCWVSLPMTIILSCFEAMYGFTTPIASQSLLQYIQSMAFIVRPKTIKTKTTTTTTTNKNHNNNNKNQKRNNNQQLASQQQGQGQEGQRDLMVEYHPPSTWGQIGKSLQKYIYWWAVTNILFLIIQPYEYAPFPTTRTTTITTTTTTRRSPNETFVSWDIGQWYNTFLQAYVCNQLLLFSMAGVAAVVSLLTGKQYEDRVTNHPMFLSETPSDFWGRRWNTLIHTGLKQGIYKPVRFYYTNNNATIAYLAAFIASGIIHEFVWHVLFFQTDNEQAEKEDCTTCYKAAYGKQILFFGWNGVLLVMEQSEWGQKIWKLLKLYLPRFVLGHFVVLLSLPVGHLFTGDLIEAGTFHQSNLGFFLIKVTKQ